MVAAKGPFMISLAILSGACVWGCTQSTTWPPAASVPQRPAWRSPGMHPLPPHSVPPQFQPPFDQPPQWGPERTAPSPVANPWKPAARQREWRSIVLHHTATSRGSVESIHETHLRRKDASGNPWQGIGYHFVIGNGDGMPDGEIETTFRWREQMHGAHAGDREHNDHGIGIVLVGNFDDGPPSPAQLEAVKQLVGTLKTEYGISDEDVIGHADIKATACPGRYFPLAEVRRSDFEQFAGKGGRRSAPLRFAGREGNRTP